MPSLTTSPAGVKPAPMGARTTRDETPDTIGMHDPEQILLCVRAAAVAKSRMMFDARQIAKAAEDLIEMLERFADEHTANSIVADVRKAGVEINEEYYRGVAR